MKMASGAGSAVKRLRGAAVADVEAGHAERGGVARQRAPAASARGSSAMARACSSARIHSMPIEPQPAPISRGARRDAA